MIGQIVGWLEQLFLVLGVVFAVLGNLGVLIFPDVYTRLQASSTLSTTSVFSFFVAGMLHAGISPLTGKIVVLTLFFLISSPVSAHLVARFAWDREVVPWRNLRRRNR